MVTRLLYLSGLLCLLIATGVQAQQLKVVAETESFKDYELINDKLSILSPYGVTVPVVKGTPQYQVLEQSVIDVDIPITPEKAAVLALSDLSSPLIESSQPANDRGKMVSSLNINIVRTGEDNAKVLRKLRLRVYKTGDKATPSTTVAKLASNHPLSSGIWYKIPVDKNGIYELSSEYLSGLGIDINSINPRNIQIWGTDGYQLPEANNEQRSEFTQIPILVQGENDGNFNAGDRVLFYGNSPHKVLRDENEFSHQIHPYSNQRFIFLTIGQQEGDRLSAVNNSLSSSRNISTFYDFIWKDEELYKAEEKIKSGRYWLGQRFNASSNGVLTTVLRDTIAGISQNPEVRISGQFVGRSENNNSFNIQLNGESAATLTIPSISGGYNSSEGTAGVSRSFSTSINPVVQNGRLEVEASFNHNESNSTGFVDWLRIVVERNLEAKNNRLFFYSPADGASDEIVRYQLSGFSQEPVVMDVTEVTSPKLLSVSGSGSNYTFNYYSGNNLQLIAQSNFYTPAEGEEIDTPNLHGISEYPDYIIVTADDFLQSAQELADYRANNDGLTPVVVTQKQILNEFSGGAVDPSAIRDYVKFLYDRAMAAGQTLPRYLLLFGDATFDYKNIMEDGFTNHVITYQSKESLGRISSFATDDFFGFLDDHEGEIGSGSTGNTELLDVGLGRISSQTKEEAAIAVQKIKAYEDPANTGLWQNLFTFAADDDFPDVERNRDLHVLNADETAHRMNIIEPGIRLKKVYEFAYPEEITGSGRQIPGATDEFMNSMNNGTLVLNYSGHGNEQTLSDEELFTSDMIPSLTNEDKLAVLVTATCQFGRYDDIDAQSGAEKLFFAENGGVVAAFTTTRVVFTGPGISTGNNFGLNVALSQHMLGRDNDGSALRMGDIYRNSKNAMIGGSLIVSSRNSKKFILIGDPATKFRLPENQASLNTINDYTEAGEDTTLNVRALDQVTLTGQVTDQENNILTGYSGEATITVLDAPRSVSLPVTRNWVAENRCYLKNRSFVEDCSYQVENDVLFKGKAAVENGTFISSFVVPKDINYSSGTGRIIFFTDANGSTAGGSFAKINFNGINPKADSLNDGKGPALNVFLNDERFVNGSLINSSPNLIIELEDQSGINTTGTGVGHEIIATIDTKPQQSFVLNDFYEGSLDDYTRGRIEYPLDQLPEGS
ncbi:MAG: type IX secretion system sortase PorU, partial [Balneolaceae bacterium]